MRDNGGMKKIEYALPNGYVLSSEGRSVTEEDIRDTLVGLAMARELRAIEEAGGVWRRLKQQERERRYAALEESDR